MIDFNENHTNSIKSIVTEKNSTVKLTTRFMFSKRSLTRFVCGVIYSFSFPDENVKKIYGKCNIQKCFLYHNLSDTDITLLFFFVFVCNMNSQVSEKESRNILKC